MANNISKDAEQAKFFLQLKTYPKKLKSKIENSRIKFSKFWGWWYNTEHIKNLIIIIM